MECMAVVVVEVVVEVEVEVEVEVGGDRWGTGGEDTPDIRLLHRGRRLLRTKLHSLTCCEARSEVVALVAVVVLDEEEEEEVVAVEIA
jgi:hypothetical protein